MYGTQQTDEIHRDWEIEWIAGEKRVFSDTFMSQWLEWFRNGHRTVVFQHPLLIQCWWETRGRLLGANVEVCKGLSDDGAIVVLPFIRRRRVWRNLWLNRLECLGEPNFDYQHPLICGQDVAAIMVQKFWAAMSESLSDRGVDCCSIRRMTSEFSPHGAVPDTGKTAPRISLAGFRGWEDFEKSLSSNLRGDLRRRKRRLAELGSTNLRVMSRDDSCDAEKKLPAMMLAHRAQWKNTPSENYFQTPGLVDFYRLMIRRLQQEGVVHFSELVLNEEPMAWHFGFEHRAELHWYKPVISEKHAALSPGKLLLAALAEEAIRNHWQAIDLGVGDEEYKLRWMNSQQPLFQQEWEFNTVRTRLRQRLRA